VGQLHSKLKTSELILSLRKLPRAATATVITTMATVIVAARCRLEINALLGLTLAGDALAFLDRKRSGKIKSAA